MLLQGRKTAISFIPLRYFLAFVILIEGYVSISIEILTIRQLLPVVGGSVVVTSLIIGIFLLFLALGYQAGGRNYKNPRQRLSNNFLIAAICLGVGLSYIFISLFFYRFVQTHHVLYALSLFLLLVIAPLIFVLGQTVPITMNMVKDENLSAGHIGGKTLGLSTIGSFLGATLTTLVGMYFFGVAWTIVIDFFLLATLALLLTEHKQELMLKILIISCMSICVWFLNVDIENKFFIRTNHYANYQILTHPQDKMLIINDTFSSYLNKKAEGFAYIEAIKKIIFNDLKLKNANILVLGAGGFSLTASGTHHNHFTYVEIDPQLKSVVKGKFITKINAKLFVDDARHFLKTTTQKYQVIVIDAYSDLHAIPMHLLSVEYMQNIKTKLLNSGIAIFNIIANPMMQDPYSQHVDNTIRQVFPHCAMQPLHYTNHDTNILYVCSKTKSDKQYYTDNLNHSTFDLFMR